MVQNKKSLVFSLLNVNTLNDNKLQEYDNLTKDHHVQFITELNCSNVESENILKSNDLYNWQFIGTDYTTNSARIAIRYPANQENKINIKILDEGRIDRPERFQKQKDVIQFMTVKVVCYHKIYKVMLVYRTPDADGNASRQNTQSLFNIIDKTNPDICLGDFNLDQNIQKIKQETSKLCRLKQIVGCNTRIAPAKNDKISKTLIDLVFVKWERSSNFKIKVVDTTISDHKMVIITINVKIPPVKVDMPIPIDKFRRYFPQKGIQWSKVRFKFDQNKQSSEDTDTYYKNLVETIKACCDELGIVKLEKPFIRRKFRFNMSVKTRNLKSERNRARKYYYELKSAHEFGWEIFDENLVKDSFIKFKKLRNKFNMEAKKDRKRSLTKQFKKYTNDSKRLWSVVNRAKGKATGMVENLKDPIFNNENMAQFFHERSKIAHEDKSDFPVVPNTIEELYLDNEDEKLKNFEVKIDQFIIAKVMQYKPDPTADPDGLSMLIWNMFYNNVLAARIAINQLFFNVFNKSYKIPGLEEHDIKLFLKIQNPTREKDLRPVASLNSIPKRMLKILYEQVKK